MALIINLKSLDNLPGKADRFIKVKFRGTSQSSGIIHNCKDCAIFNQTFSWPVARGLENEDLVSLELYNFNKYKSNKLVGKFEMYLQELAATGNLILADYILDPNNTVTGSIIRLELQYHSPDGTVGNWAIDEVSVTESFMTEQDTDSGGRKKNDGTSFFGSAQQLFDTDILGAWTSEVESDDEATGEVAVGTKNKLKVKPIIDDLCLKEHNFQVNITIHEARELPGLDTNPMVIIEVGTQRKFTSVRKSTNCPHFGEFFAFDFKLPKEAFMDQVISLMIIHSGLLSQAGQAGQFVGNMLNMGSIVGGYKIDVRTVYDNTDHQFCQRWAQLIDPKDINGGLKGFLKVDITVLSKGEGTQYGKDTKREGMSEEELLSKKSDTENIQQNLLLPRGIPEVRHRASYQVRIYKAEDLPRMKSGLMANVKKAMTGDDRPSVSPYVQVSFAGQTGRTSADKSTYDPAWNEQVVFTDLFPPLCQRIKVQLRDDDMVLDSVIGTHYVNMNHISSRGAKGFMHTFGPCWVNLYGSPRGYMLTDSHDYLNDGIGEGVAYRGRLLIAVKVEILGNSESSPLQVTREATMPISENAAGVKMEYFLWGTILEATMIDKKFADKFVSFELSMGNYGNSIDGKHFYRHTSLDEHAQEEPQQETEEMVLNQTPPMKPHSRGKNYYHIPFHEKKPCLYAKTRFEDQRQRLQRTNVLNAMVESLEDELKEVQHLLDHEEPGGKRMRRALSHFANSCSQFCNSIHGQAARATSGKTKLDKERLKMLERKISKFGTEARQLKAGIKSVEDTEKVLEAMKKSKQMLKKVKDISEEPQHSIPDVFIWMIVDKKRIAYCRVDSKTILHSTAEEEMGRYCGKVHTRFLRLPGKKAMGSSGWTIQAKLEVYLWLGSMKNIKAALSGLHSGYNSSPELKHFGEKTHALPTQIVYAEKSHFQLRAHVYGARGLVGSDESGLSDPFAHVVCGDGFATTQVIPTTLTPLWDETLVLEKLCIYGDIEEVAREPPLVLIEVFDEDRVGSAEFLGRTLAKPKVKVEDEGYIEPKFPALLDWYDIYRGPMQCGEILASFELFQINEDDKDFDDLPKLGEKVVVKKNVKKKPKGKDKSQAVVEDIVIHRVPKEIRPTLSKYRIEVLFWGLRELKRLMLLSVDKPRVDIEIGKTIISSDVIMEASKNPNFPNMVKYDEVMLPDNDHYCPPITIRCVDCRSFGRFELVGIHVISAIHKYRIKADQQTDCSKDTVSLVSVPNGTVTNGSVVGVPEVDFVTPGKLHGEKNGLTAGKDRRKSKGSIMAVDEVAIEIDEKAPLLPNKTEALTEEEEEALDWWTRFHASWETFEKLESERKEQERKELGLDKEDEMGFGKIEIPKDDEEDKKKKKKKVGFFKRMKNFKKSTSSKINKIKGATNQAFDDLDDFFDEPEDDKANIPQFTVYNGKLEDQPEFEKFQDLLHSFTLKRGKKTDDEEDDDHRIAGIFKGCFRIYKLDKEEEALRSLGLKSLHPKLGTFQGVPKNDMIGAWVRVYVIQATDLHPADVNGKADPYVVLKLGKTVIDDKEQKINCTLNPVFGKCYSFDAEFPLSTVLTIQIYDWDQVGMDDLIGQTQIDLEDRFYSKHRGTCGLARTYESHGFNQWRDTQKPSQILQGLCQTAGIEQPVYDKVRGSVKIAGRTYNAPTDIMDEGGVVSKTEEHMALEVLNHWQDIQPTGCYLMPEHVEIRQLELPDKKGIEQGKLHMWIDMFPMSLPPPAPHVDITPRKPKSYELRVIVWNTDEVVLEDTAALTGEKMSDIYVRGWLTGPEDSQSTDVHYRSLTGEGNFNWRFVFPFDYMIADEKIVVKKKEFLWDNAETEVKLPARLELQVWDADLVSRDDCLGQLTLDLNRIPMGSKQAKALDENVMMDIMKGKRRTVSLLKQTKMRGWWPFTVKAAENEEQEFEMTGKAELEIQLLTAEEAEKSPAGLGREEPDGLPPPNRPDTSFIWFLNPWKSLKYILWANFKYKILKFFIFMLITAFIAFFIYAAPGYTAKKMLGA